MKKNSSWLSNLLKNKKNNMKSGLFEYEELCEDNKAVRDRFLRIDIFFVRNGFYNLYSYYYSQF